MTANTPVEACTCCGCREFVGNKVLWPDLIQEWRLSPCEVEYIDRQQGLTCLKCGSNLRSMALALAVCRCYGHAGTFKEFVEDPKNHHLRVLEINEAGQLTQFLTKLPGHTLAKYPDLDMTRMHYAEHSYDLVLHSDTLEHVLHPITGLAECYRILAPGGFCAFTIPMIVDRMTFSREGLPRSYHGSPEPRAADFAVQTEYGCDAWKHLVLAGFEECRVIALEFPSALALVGRARAAKAGVHTTISQNAETKRGAPLALENTGERMMPESSDRDTFWEHVHRYAFACRFVAGKRLLDIACGEGYGSAALQRAGAAQVIGVDISEAACAHASDKYGIDARIGSAEQIPLPDASVDVVVSFETIEHVPEPSRFLDECARILVPGGRLIISTPNKEVYSGPGRPRNPFHCSEMSEDEFLSRLGSRFRAIKLYSQHPQWAPWWSPQTLSAEETPWDWLYPLRRLRRSARFRLSDPSPQERSAVIEQILNPGRTGLSALFPYAVQEREKGSRERPFYFVATAVSQDDSG